MSEDAPDFSWTIATPLVYRYLPDQFVRSFMATGALRISSFAKFHKHEDEQRLDTEEGKSMFLHRTLQKSGQTIFARLQHGRNAYVLSTTTRHDPALMGQFGCDSFFRINDPTLFGLAVAKQVGGIVAGLEGPCIYQTTKVIERDLGFLALPPPEDRPGWKVDRAGVTALIHAQAEHLPFLLKHAKYQHQFEYRFVWIIKGDVAEHPDVAVPQAVYYCSGPDLFSL